MIQAFRNIWSVPDLRKRVLFTLAMLGVYRIGAHIPTPGVNAQALLNRRPRSWPASDSGCGITPCRARGR